jgi:uncharacterized damage-inducible protein DinB
MNGIEVIVDGFGRIQGTVRDAVSGLSAAQLNERLDGTANSIGWLVWHLTRVQDDHVAGVAGVDQAWTGQGWSSRFGLPYADDAIGYGQSSEEVGAFVLSDPGLLTGYHEAVHSLTRSALDGLADDDLSRVVDERWDPPVTVAVRLVSVVNDIGQHVGQAAYVRGLIERRR